MFKKYLTALFAGAMTLSLPVLPLAAADGPKVIMRTVVFNTNDQDRVWPDPNKEPKYNTPAWTPNNRNLNFMIEGPIEGGSQIKLEITRPDGKPWLMLNCNTPELEAGKVDEVTCDDVAETKAIAMTGFFGFRILLANELTGTNLVLMKGRLKVAQFKTKYNNKINHYIDDDWRLPIAFIQVTVINYKMEEEDAPYLNFYTWMRGRDTNRGVSAHMFYQGKQVDMANSADVVLEKNTNVEALDPKAEHSYQCLNFFFTNVKAYAKPSHIMSYPNAHFLNKNPGDYEVKVLRSGKLVRVVKFKVGADGKIVAPGLVEKDGGGNARILLPAQVMGDLDGNWDKNAWKTEMFYGNLSPATSGIVIGQ